MAKPEEKRVLVVDDDPDIVYYLSTALEDAGFRVETAFSVDQALAKITAAPPDFVSLDLVMPQKSGIVLFHELHRNPAWSKIPVLFVTGQAKEEQVRRDLHAALAESSMSGPNTYLEKPVTAARFVEVVAKTLGVELEGSEPSEPAGADVRQEVASLLEGADAEALREVLRLLRSKSETQG